MQEKNGKAGTAVAKKPKAVIVKRKKTKLENEMMWYLPLLIVSVLKTCSDKDNPMTADDIAKEIARRTGLGDACSDDGYEGADAIGKTIERKLSSLERLGQMYEAGRKQREKAGAPEDDKGSLPINRDKWDTAVVLDLYRGLGGYVKYTEAKSNGKKGRRKAAYYFEPILSEGDISYICAALESTHYLSQKEKDYLILRESAACGYWADARDEERIGNGKTDPEKLWKKLQNLPNRPKWDTDVSMPTKNNSMLSKIRKIQYAIHKGIQIEIIYGEYVPGAKKQPEFRDKGQGKTYYLNPYAMLSQNGMYYVIVTHRGHTNPTHFRIDRIRRIELGDKREKIPFELERFYKGKKFQAEEYVSRFPLMQYCQEKKNTNCEFLCEAGALSVPIDYFGTEIRTEKTEDGRVRVRVSANYENVKMFCIQQCSLVTPLSPPELKADVKKVLQAAARRIR